jgi:hypothetical protein
MSRDDYAVVGAAIRQAEARMAKLAPRPGFAAYRLLLSIVAAVQSYSRLVDRVTVSPTEKAPGLSLCERAGVDKSHARRALKDLAVRGVICYRPAVRRGGFSILGLPPEGEPGSYLWEAAPAPLWMQREAGAASQSSEFGGPNQTSLGGGVGPPSEKTSEKRARVRASSPAALALIEEPCVGQGCTSATSRYDGADGSVLCDDCRAKRAAA